MVGGNCWLAVGGDWRSAVGDWRLVAVGGGWRRLVIGDWWLVAVGSGWRLAVGCRWRLAAVGGWWQLVIGSWRSLGGVLKGSPSQKKKRNLVPKGPPWVRYGAVAAAATATYSTVRACVILDTFVLC